MEICENMLFNFYCNSCDYKCCKKSSWVQHLATAKHVNANNGLIQANPKYACKKCNITFKHQSSYCRHHKKCTMIAQYVDDNIDNDNVSDNATIKESVISDKELITMLVKQNSQLMDVIKNGTNNTNHSHNNTHSHNKTFNLQFFLNETCKDAMNINEFVSSIKPQLADLEATGRLGYVEGVSNIIINNLKSLNIHNRPIHCSDQKREVIYIKNNNEWTKEEDDKPILTRAIKVIANENIKNISEWRNEHPDCTNADSKKNNLYLKIVSNAMSGSSAEESHKNISKIISNVAKRVSIDKHLYK
jgi:hypothetical protein